MTHRKNLSLMSAASVICGVAALPAHAQFFANAGFETPPATTANGGLVGGELLQSGNLNSGNGNTYNPSYTFVGGGGITINSGAYQAPAEAGSAQVALLQQAGSFNENVAFAQAGTYRVVLADAQRPGNSVNQTIQVVVDGNLVSTLTPISSTAFNDQTTASFTVTAGSHNISIVGVGAGTADISGFVDNARVISAATGSQVNVIPITNGSFESFFTGAGYGTPNGFTGVGGVGTNRAATQSGLFANNGSTPDGGSVAFLQGTASLSQNLSGFTIGQNYLLTFFDNARSGAGNATVAPVVTLGTQTLFGSPATFIGAVGGTNQYNFISVPFTYTAAFNGGSTSSVFKIASTTSGGDGTLLVDAIQITGLASAPEPGSLATMLLGGIGLAGTAFTARRRKYAAQ